MTFLGFDPSAAVRMNDAFEGFCEVTFSGEDSGGYRLAVLDEDGGALVEVLLRPDFLDALIAARTREAAA